MRLGISSFTYHYAITRPLSPDSALQPDDLLARSTRFGVRVVQFGDSMPLDRLTDAALVELKDASIRADLQLEVGMRGFKEPLIHRYLQIAADLASPILRIVVDTPECEPSRDEVVATLRRVAPEFEAAGIALAVENHDRFRSAQLREIMDAVASPNVGICLDTVNSLVALEDPYTVTETLAGYTVNLHIKDVRARRDDTGLGVVIQGAPAGQGQVDIPWVIDRVRAAGRDPNAILEQWTPLLDDPRATIDQEARWAEEGIAYLRTLIPD